MLEARKHPSSGPCKLILIISPDIDLGFQMGISLFYFEVVNLVKCCVNWGDWCFYLQTLINFGALPYWKVKIIIPRWILHLLKISCKWGNLLNYKILSQSRVHLGTVIFTFQYGKAPELIRIWRWKHHSPQLTQILTRLTTSEQKSEIAIWKPISISGLIININFQWPLEVCFLASNIFYLNV